MNDFGARKGLVTLAVDIVVEPVFLQNPIQLCVERMRRTPRQVLCCDPHRLLAEPSLAFAHSHARTLLEEGQLSR